MCGRFAYNKEQITPWAKDVLGVVLDAESNLNASPSQSVIALNNQLAPFAPHWGIKPSWAKKLLINAQAESVATKPTFKQAFATRRCVVPMSGWFEWKDEGGARKQKYYFSLANGQPLLMAGIWYEQQVPELVTLTTQPNERCKAIHKRMPVIIPVEGLEHWFNAENPSDLLLPLASEAIVIAKA